jgi:hypothetical protein
MACFIDLDIFSFPVTPSGYAFMFLHLVVLLIWFSPSLVMVQKKPLVLERRYHRHEPSSYRLSHPQVWKTSG